MNRRQAAERVLPWGLRETVVTFDEAKAKANLPGGVDWQFATTAQKNESWSSDEHSRSDWCHAIYGRTEGYHVFVGLRHFVNSEDYIGGSRTDTWDIRTNTVPIRADEGLEPAFLYGNIVKALKMVGFGKRFNSKVRDVRGDSFDAAFQRLSASREMSIKHWLVESGEVAGDAPSVAGRKNVIEITYEKYSGAPKHNHAHKVGDYYYEAVSLVVNGNAEYLSERDLAKFVNAGLVRKIFGTYVYGGEKKSLNRMRNGKQLMEAFLKNFSLSAGTRAALEATLAQKA